MSSTEAEIDRILSRYRVPPEDGQEILDDVMLTMLVKRERIRDPERWLRRTLRNRCVHYWRQRRRHLYRVVDSGILALLNSEATPEAEREELRQELGRAADGLPGRCRAVVRQRYGLGSDAAAGDVTPWDPTEAPSDDLLRCVGALSRRLAPSLPEEPEDLPAESEESPEVPAP